MICGLAAQVRWMRRKTLIKQYIHLSYTLKLICKIGALEVFLGDSA
jgi:hypothetical protein